MLLKGIGATTELDRHNCRFTREALENAANDVNDSGYVPSVGINHDSTIMPFGKVIRAEVLPMDNGEYKMEITQEIFEEEYFLELEGGTRYILNKSSCDERPFVEDDYDSNDTTVSIDLINFENQEDISEIQELVEEYSALNGIIARKALIPDPEIIFQVANGIVGVLLSKKVIDSVGDRVLNNLLDEVDKFYALIRELIVKYSKLAIPKNRPQMYVFKMWDECNIELVVVTTYPEEVMESIKKEKLNNINNELIDLKQHFMLRRIQFIYENGNWIFNYLCTDKGEVIGTEKSYNKRVKAFELFKAESDKIDAFADE
ncbi:hypothetical protein [Clostridium algidicarnis]|uniref:hypothetical protein n=1 Tax=Clostridium algidicarnis TaxID=37659 RepID=UPI001C0AC5EB|nr:hypothetical protein [Clostridium algidicarnis]MBU3202747.1 hypothetical protein [Clostridium algidicarnis]MBU3210901.1 hypothetical protein [Clostridium algidicarnis]MBU3222591.1 hypothetical protein [Clostridium algidicarnis]